jgi:hypothetical protein
MHRSGSGFLLTLSISLVIALTGCLGKSSGNAGNEGVASVTLSPGESVSMDVGTTQPFTATARNGSGSPILGLNIQFLVTSGTPGLSAPLSITSSGDACAGTWNAGNSVCNPGPPGVAIITAVTNGVSSLPTTVYIHQHIDSIQIQQAESQPPVYDCFSQTQTWTYKAIAYSNNVDISQSVGPMTWSFSNNDVVTVTATIPTGQPNVLNQAQTVAKSPGITNIFASNSGTTSSPFPYTTCLVQYIRLQIGGQGEAGDSITVNNGGNVPITATAVDTIGYVLTAPPLTWSTTKPEVAAFSTITNATGTNNATARNNLGGATLFASCTPPSCNIGILPGLPIFASTGLLPNGQKGYGTISVDVTTTTNPPTYIAWAATTDCFNQPGCTSAMFDVEPTINGTNPIGAIISLPRTPNSMMFNHVTGDRIYLGSNQGLMYVDVSANSPSVSVVSSSSTCDIALCGTVLTISNDGTHVVVADNVSPTHQIYIYNGTTSTTAADLIIPGESATAAAYSPDQSKIFILTATGTMYVYSTVDALTSVPLATSVTDIKFSADGSFAYLAGNPTATTISGFATCNAQQTVPNLSLTPDAAYVTTPGIPYQIFPSPDAQHFIVFDPVNGSIDIFATVDQIAPLPYDQYVCSGPAPLVDIAPTVNFPTAAQSYNLGQAKNFSPVLGQLVADGTQFIVIARQLPAVLIFDVGQGTTTSVPLSDPLGGDTDPLSADVSTDGSQVYIAACDQYPNNDPTQPCTAGSIHIVNLAIGAEIQDVPYANINDANNPNMCNTQGGSAPLCLPNLVAIKPQ